jgi:hypothetical protein
MTEHASATRELERRARRNVGMRVGWIIHAMVYVAVNAGLVALSAQSSRPWAVFPVLGWGLGLAIHGAVVWWVTGSGMQRMQARELARLQAEQAQQSRQAPESQGGPRP